MKVYKEAEDNRGKDYVIQIKTFPTDYADKRRFELKVYKVVKSLVISTAQLLNDSTPRQSTESAGNNIL